MFPTYKDFPPKNHKFHDNKTSTIFFPIKIFKIKSFSKFLFVRFVAKYSDKVIISVPRV